MRWTWAILLLAGGRAERRVVVEDFAKAGLWTDTGEVLGLPESIQPPIGTINLTNEGETLRFDYDVAFRALYGAAVLGRTLNGPYDQCANATHVSLKYKVLEPQSRFHLGTLMFCLLDGSDCSGEVCGQGRQGKGTTLELWMHFDPVRLDDTSGEWRELRLGLCGRSGTTRTPFFNMEGFYENGNDTLDPGSLRGFMLGLMMPSDRPGEATSGSLLFDEIACIEDAGADPCAEPANRTGAALSAHRPVRLPSRPSDMQFVPSAASEVHEWGHQQCDELCAASETCLYYMTYGGLNALTARFPTCYLYDALRAEDLRPASAVDFERSSLESFWVQDDEAKRGALCDVCSCASDAANCTNRDLKTVPFGSDPITSLDLRGNPQLVLIGPGAFKTSLETLSLPSGIAHVAPETLLALPALREVSLAEDGDGVPRNFVDASGTGRFHDVCCGRGESVAGISFCDYQPSEPGKSDTMYREFERAAYYDIIEALPDFELYVPSSPFLAEASESVDKCAAVCAMNARCLSFAFYIRTDLDSSSPTASARCHLYTEAPSVTAYEGGAAPDPEAPDPRVHIIGLPPRTRAARNSTVIVTPARLDLSEGNEYKGSFEVSLGADPLRGAVWVTPRLEATGLDVTFEPPSVSLYDATTRVTIEVAVRGDVTRDFTPIVTLDVVSCDPAFSTVKPTVQLDILAPPSSSKNNARRARRERRSLITAFAVIGALVGALLLLWAAHTAWRFAKKKQALEMDRAVLVRQQVSQATERVQEFQAHFCVMPGDKFCAMESLQPHEKLADLIRFGSISKVKQAMRRGKEVFIFLSHQWLAFDQPDPDNVHFTAMKQAVTAVAADAGVPIDKTRVWVDYCSIPQENQSEQRLAIASLPTFSSSCNYFVVVAPTTMHADILHCTCDSRTYRKRAWCRAEIMSCWARNGTASMYVNTNEGLRPLATDDKVLLEALDVFGGDLTCCRLGHEDGRPCDREALVLPMLGLYGEIYKNRCHPCGDAYSFIEPAKDKMFPRTFRYNFKDDDGVARSKETVLFGDTIRAVGDLCGNQTLGAPRHRRDAVSRRSTQYFSDWLIATQVEIAVEMSEASDSDPLWKKALPDLAPATNNSTHAHHLQLAALKSSITTADSSNSRTMRLRRSLSTVVRSGPSSPFSPRPTSPFQTHSSLASARPVLSRGTTWRTSAPRIAHDDSKEDLNV